MDPFPTTEKPLVHTCTVCGAQFASRNAVFKHVKVDHLETPAIKRPKVDEVDEPGTHVRLKADIRTAQEDDWYRVIIKPQGVATMGSVGEETVISSDALLLDPSSRTSFKKASICHRLDRDTGGLLVCSKHKPAERAIKMSFRSHKVHKRYRAIVMGKLEPAEGSIDTKLSDQDALTRYKVISCTASLQYGFVTTVDLWPLTGRKHQLRKHLQSVGHAIVGDVRYSSALHWPTHPFQFMFLWALEIDFPHPARFDASVDDHEHGSDEDEGTTIDDNDREATAVSVVRDVRPEEYPERVVVLIEEPAYYQEFRLFHEAAVRQGSQ
jgi:23S rRNA-/tRNA-specific pseudouridylate synthase